MGSHKTKSKIVAFSGPSLHGVSLPPQITSTIEFLPPAKRGDVGDIIENKAADKIILIDGHFHSHPAVGHSELLDALQMGIEVWGLSSMGAIRAFEMAPYGMKGFGEVYKLFASQADFMDDEVALTHAPFPPYHPISEPLVNIRYFFQHLISQSLISTEDVNQYISELKGQHFENRTLDYLFSFLRDRGHGNLKRFKAEFYKFRIKNIDADNFFNAKPWTK